MIMHKVHISRITIIFTLCVFAIDSTQKKTMASYSENLVLLFLICQVLFAVSGKETKPCSHTHKGRHLIGAYVPQCDKHGYYKLLQCYGSIGSCWCVNKYGKKIVDITNPQSLSDDICNQPCFQQIKRITSEKLPFLIHGEPIARFTNLPLCDKDGFFLPKQTDGTEYWCVDKFGTEVLSTRQTNKNLHCHSKS